MQSITLYELNQQVKEAIAQSFSSKYWVIAEISELKENSSGHCYLELIQKEDSKDFPKAKARATIWAYTYRMLKPYFETATGRSLSGGIKVLVQVEVVFHELYGYSLNIIDIEPSFTIGDIEQKRRETIEKLVGEGVFDMNKGLEIPLLPKRVAIVSSPTAAGLQDFTNQLLHNNAGYAVEQTLFAANMQGNEAENSIIEALNSIYDRRYDFDIVVIIRGGGSQADLSCFDSYWLAAHVAQFPLPIITGIGHDKDVSVVDLIAHTKLKTPTAVAEFILDRFTEFETLIDEYKIKLIDSANERLSEATSIFDRALSTMLPSVTISTTQEKINIEKIQNKINLLSYQVLSSNKSELTLLSNSFVMTSANFIDFCKNKIEKYESKNTLLDPEHILKRGYSITLLNGKVLTDAALLNKGKRIRTILLNGEFESTVA